VPYKKTITTFSEILFIAGVITLGVSIIMASKTLGDRSYELSIYQSYKPTFWVLIIMSLILGYLAGISSLISRPDSYSWVWALILIIATNVIVLLLPYLRGYAFVGQWDSVNHYGNARNILENGSLNYENFYPAVHVLLATISNFSGVELHTVNILAPTLFYLLYLANVSFMIWLMDESAFVRGVTLLAASPLVLGAHGTTTRPVLFSAFMLPLFWAWMYVNKYQRRNVVAIFPMILLLFFYPFLHPVGVLAVVISIAVFAAAIFWTSGKSSTGDLFLTPLLIIVTAWWLWFSTFKIFDHTLNRLVDSFIISIGGAHSIEALSNAAARSGASISRILSLILFRFGALVVYLIPIAVGSLWLLFQFIKNKRDFSELRMIAILFSSLFVLIAGLSLLKDLVSQNPERFFAFSIIGVPLLMSTLLGSSIKLALPHKMRSNVQWIGSLLLVAFAALIGIFSAYSSPNVGQPNSQYTYAQQAGLAFFVDHAIDDIDKIYSPFRGEFVLSAVLTADDLDALRKDSPQWWIEPTPAHFTEGDDSTASSFADKSYMWLTAPEFAYYTEIWPDGGRFNPEDFNKLHLNSKWDQIYTSSDFTLWKRRSK
jgi:hypothetical protein